MSALSWWAGGKVPILGVPRRYATYVEEAWHVTLRFTLPWLVATLATSAMCIYLAGRLCREKRMQVRTGAQGVSRQ
jgi:hypothetical protein